MAGQVEFRDNTNEVLEALAKAKHRGLKAIGMTAERHAKKDPNMPVDTGLARNSITFALSGEEARSKEYKSDDGTEQGEYNGTAEGKKGESVYIGSNVQYFPFIELGSRMINARHVLQNAASNHGEEYKRLMEESLKNA
jgi:hypothetical protein